MAILVALASIFVLYVLGAALGTAISSHGTGTALTLGDHAMEQPLSADAPVTEVDAALDTLPVVRQPPVVRAHVSVIVDNLDPQTETATIHVLVSLPEQLANMVTRGDPMCNEPTTVPGAIRLVVDLPAKNGSLPEPLFDHVITPDDLATAAASSLDPSVPLDLGAVPLTSAKPADFPFDSYLLTLDVQLELTGTQLIDLAGACVRYLPVKAYTQVSERLEDLPATTARATAPFPAASWSPADRFRVESELVQVHFERPYNQRFLTVVAASIPLLLACLFGLTMFAPHRRNGPSFGHLDFLVGIAASLLAILPLRAVLLPSAIQARTFTVLDLMLALEAAVLVMIAAVHPFIKRLRE